MTTEIQRLQAELADLEAKAADASRRATEASAELARVRKRQGVSEDDAEQAILAGKERALQVQIEAGEKESYQLRHYRIPQMRDKLSAAIALAETIEAEIAGIELWFLKGGLQFQIGRAQAALDNLTKRESAERDKLARLRERLAFLTGDDGAAA